MPRKNLTVRFVESVKVETRTDFWDDVVRGLVLRVSETGVKSWTVVYTQESDSTKRRVTIGKFPSVSLDSARQKALATVTAVGEGKDPSSAKRARREAMTVADLGALYIEKYARRTKKTWAQDERILKADVYPAIGKMKILLVKRRDLLDIIEEKFEDGYIAQSGHVLAVIRKMLNWAVDSDYLEASPALGIRPRGKAVKRDRVLSTAEVRAIWNALPEASMTPQTASILRLLFLTGQRSGEVCGMLRSEIDVKGAAWTIPGARTKNGLTHVVPLSTAALEIITNSLDKAGDERTAPLFTRTGDPIESNAISQAARKHLQLFDEAWTPHDIRRTVATMMSGIGILPHIIESVLNHVSGFKSGVAGVYNRNLYEPEKRRALDMWAEHLDGIISGKKAVVVPMVKPA